MLYNVCKKATGSHSIHHQHHNHRMNASTAVWLMPYIILLEVYVVGQSPTVRIKGGEV